VAPRAPARATEPPRWNDVRVLVFTEYEDTLRYRDGERVKQTTKAFEETKVNLQQLYEHWEEAVELNSK
jgi:hypothetical protein